MLAYTMEALIYNAEEAKRRGNYEAESPSCLSNNSRDNI